MNELLFYKIIAAFGIGYIFNDVRIVLRRRRFRRRAAAAKQAAPSDTPKI